jgi:LacI family transcriptional regulator
MKRRPTITDVAALAGVSKSTVSLVLQGSPQVRAETARGGARGDGRIGYVYNRAAATLRGSSVGLVGLVINDLRNPFFTEFAASPSRWRWRRQATRPSSPIPTRMRSFRANWSPR